MPWWVEIYPSGYANRRGFLASVRSRRVARSPAGFSCLNRERLRSILHPMPFIIVMFQRMPRVPFPAQLPVPSTPSLTGLRIEKATSAILAAFILPFVGLAQRRPLQSGEIMSSSHVRLTACETGRAPVIGSQVIRAEVQVTFYTKRDSCLDIGLLTSGINNYPILLF